MVKVIFLHPDLGIGGAERLVVDAAVALQEKGHDVTLFTTHHDPEHCFPETKDGRLSVRCHLDWLPRSVCGRLVALCMYVRMLLLAALVRWWLREDYLVAVVDQVSACVPVIRTRSAKVLFYCHFPDQLLTHRSNVFKRVYRYPLDWLEQVTTGCADRVVVNSNFTATVFRDTFPALSHITPQVIYPSMDFSSKFDALPPSTLPPSIPRPSSAVFLSLNRYERKKNLKLALEAFSLLLKHIRGINCTSVKSSTESLSDYHQICGGLEDHQLFASEAPREDCVGGKNRKCSGNEKDIAEEKSVSASSSENDLSTSQSKTSNCNLRNGGEVGEKSSNAISNHDSIASSQARKVIPNNSKALPSSISGIKTPPLYSPNIHLVMAGGYDRNNVENVEHFDELQSCLDELSIEPSQVTFMRSIDDTTKTALLRHSTALLYTPENEHFGIVPLEAMYCRTPVIACDSGGPKETVTDGETGFLRPSNAKAFAGAMWAFVSRPQYKDSMGARGRKRVETHFSVTAFSHSLHRLVLELASEG